MVAMPYVETNCVVEHDGHRYESGGAVVTPDRIIAYLGEGHDLTTWHGESLGTYLIVSSWRTPRSYVSSRMCQVEATVNGVVYTGRSAGRGMIFKGRRKAGQ